MTGNVGVAGGGGHYGTGYCARSYSRSFSANFQSASAPYSAPTLYLNWQWTNMVLNRPLYNSGQMTAAAYNNTFGNPATAAVPNPQMMFMTSNMMNQDIQINRQHQAFMSLTYTVARGMHMTPSAMYADVLLPMADPMFEDWASSGGPSWSPKKLQPPGQAMPTRWIDTQLAVQLGCVTQYMPLYTTDAAWDTMMLNAYETAYNTWAASNSGPSWAQFASQAILRVPAASPYLVPWSSQIQSGTKFGTTSGLIEFYSSTLASDVFANTKYCTTIAPMAEWWPGWDDPWDASSVGNYPLTMITPHGQYRIHSTQSGNPATRNETYRHSVWINTVDANSRGITDGQTVRVYNDVGEMRIPAYVTNKIVPGTVCVYQGSWSNPSSDNSIDVVEGNTGGATNTLTHVKSNPSGAWPFHSNVQVALP